MTRGETNSQRVASSRTANLAEIAVFIASCLGAGQTSDFARSRRAENCRFNSRQRPAEKYWYTAGVERRDRELGMDRRISRRDLLHGMGAAAAFSLAPDSLLAGLADPVGGNETPYYPPQKTGLRGAHIGSFETAHAVARDGRRDWGVAREADAGTYDLVVVGAGLSGLAAAYFWLERNEGHSVLILDNHDDFGGHAKRNEFTVDGHRLIGYGGAQSLEAPSAYPQVAKRLLASLGVELDHFYKLYDRDFYRDNKLAGAMFFNSASWGERALVRYDLAALRLTQPLATSPLTAEEAAAAMPLSAAARREMMHLMTLEDDQLGDMTYDERDEYLSTVSYRDFLERHLDVTEREVMNLFSTLTTDLGASYDAVPAIDALFYIGLPGLAAAGLPEDDTEPYIHHFPDGNASIARLIVRRLIPEAAPGSTMEDIVLADFDYSRLDVDESPVRLRLNSTVVNVEHVGGPAAGGGNLRVRYIQNGDPFEIRARHGILACNNAIIPAICPDLPLRQREALGEGLKVPAIYTNVALRNWQAFKRLGIGGVSSPGSYFQTTMLDFPVSMGGYEFSHDPALPIVVHMEHFPTEPDAGLTKREQTKLGRARMLATSFETLERSVRSQLGEMLADGGFDPADDIAAITVNRWPHGYASRDWLEDPWFEDPNDLRYAFVLGRQPFGRIAIANADAGANAMFEEACVQAHRAVTELTA